MKKRKILIISIVLIIVVTLSIIIFNSKTHRECPEIEIIDYSNSTDELIIKGNKWSGWYKCAFPKIIKNGYKIELNKEMTFNCHDYCDNLTFKIIEQNDSYIIIETTTNLSNKTFNDIKNTFKINKNDKEKISTPTLDEGTVYYIEYK